MATAKLTAAQVREIRALSAAGAPASSSQLADTYGVSEPTVRDVLTGRTWRWLPGEEETAGMCTRSKMPVPRAGSASGIIGM